MKFPNFYTEKHDSEIVPQFLDAVLDADLYSIYLKCSFYAQSCDWPVDI